MKIENRILFVDSDATALRRIEVALAGDSYRWKFSLVTSAPAALNALSNHGFDLVVTELRLPGMDGAELLAKIQTMYPSVVRVMMAEAPEPNRLEQVLAVAQRFVAKPYDIPTLLAMIDSVLGAWTRAEDPLVRTIVGRLSSLPATAETHRQLTRLMSDPECTVDQISTVVGQAPALAAKVLQVVNSAFFGLPFKVSSVAQAITYLGMTHVRGLVLLSQFFNTVDKSPTVSGFSASALQNRALTTAKAARILAPGARHRDDAFTAGLLHDIGVLALAVGMNNRYSLVLRHAQRSQRPLVEVETSFLGISHDIVGSYLAELWGLPSVIVDGILHHHRMNPVTGQNSEVIESVRLAQQATACIEAGDHWFEGTQLGAAQIEALQQELELDTSRRRRIATTAG